MIENFKHKGLRQIFESDNGRGLNAEHLRKIKQVLAVLEAAETIDALRLPTFGIACLEVRSQGLLGCDRPRELADHFSIRRWEGERCRPCRLSLRKKHADEKPSPPW